MNFCFKIHASSDPCNSGSEKKISIERAKKETEIEGSEHVWN